MFINSAYAAGETAGGGQSMLVTLIPFAFIFLVMYFLMIRPQQKHMRKKQEQLNALRRGDIVVTAGGIIGKVTKILDDQMEVEVEIADQVKIRVTKVSIADVRSKTVVAEPAGKKEDKAPKKAAAKSTAKDKVENPVEVKEPVEEVTADAKADAVKSTKDTKSGE